MPDLDAAPMQLLVDGFAADRHCPSISWGVIVDGELAATGAVGDVSEQTVFRIASMTKSFSAAATLILRDEGVLRLDDPAALHAPELAKLDRFDSAPITIRDLLSMTSGLPTDDPWADRHLDLTDAEFDQIIVDGPLFAHATGDAFEYSNFGYAVLGRVVHRATGEPLQRIITERLLDPLGMTSSTWVQPDHDDWARPMQWLDDAFTDELPPLGDGLIAPMGGIWTTVVDLATWVAWLDDAFPARDTPDDGPLSRSSRREMQSPVRYSGMRTVRGVRSPVSYGYGVQIADEETLGTVAHHSGGLPGYGSNMRWLPGRRIGAVAVCNATYAPMYELTAKLLDEANAQGLVRKAVIPVSEAVASAIDRLIALLNDWDDDAANELCTASFALDEPVERRRAAAAKLIGTTGRLEVRSIEAESATSATVQCTSESGAAVTVDFLLAPARPPRIQYYGAEVDESAD